MVLTPPLICYGRTVPSTVVVMSVPHIVSGSSVVIERSWAFRPGGGRPCGGRPRS
jgi:hypothetical protein